MNTTTTEPLPLEPQGPKTIDHKEVMARLGVSEERLLLIIMKYGIVYELEEVNDTLNSLKSESNDNRRPSRRLSERKDDILANLEEAINQVGWDRVVEYLRKNCYRMRFSEMVVEAIREREYLEETGGQFLYSEARDTLGFSKEEMIQNAGKLGISLPSFDINKLGESTILHGFFDFHSEADIMATNPEVFIIMQQRTPKEKGFKNLVRANIEALYFNPDKVFALKRKLQGSMIDLSLPNKPVTPEEPEDTKAAEPVVRTKKGCRNKLLFALLIAGAVSGGATYYQYNKKQVQAWIESLGLHYLLEWGDERK